MAKDLEKEEVTLNQVAETMGDLKARIKSSVKAKKEASAEEVVEETVVEEVEETKEESKVEFEQPEFLKQLLDPENKDNIEFFDEEGNLLSFEQVAIVPHVGKVYVILKPIDKMEGVGEDEALVFVIDFDEYLMQPYLKIVEDDIDIDIIFEKYYDLLREAGVDVDGEDGFKI